MFRIDRVLVNLQDMQELHANNEAGGINREARGKDAERMRLAEQMAEELLEQARAEAELKIQTAEIEAEEIRAQAWQAGYDDGRNEGRAEAETEARLLRERDVQTLEEALAALGRAHETMVDRCEEDMIELCLAMVKKIVNDAVLKEAAVFESMLKKALQQMKWEGELVIRVSGEVYERFFPSGSATFVVGDKSVNATLRDDPSMRGGDCVIEADGETINAGVDSQLKYIALAFRQGPQL